MDPQNISSSFRDPSGFIFRHTGDIYRQINASYAHHYDMLISTGLFESLLSKGWLIPHEEIAQDSLQLGFGDECYKIIRPQAVPYVSYPYEWCFSQLKDAALLTLSIQSEALHYGLTLKDASAYNVQFVEGKPVFIDTLSFEQYREGEPWIAYRQFCQHFLGPLAVMAFCDLRLRNLLQSFIDGLPLDLVSRLLPRRTMAKYSFLAHIHLHAMSQRRHHDDARQSDAKEKIVEMSKSRLLALTSSLRNTIDKCRLKKVRTEWGDYYEDTNYSSQGMSAKERLVVDLVQTHLEDDETIHDVGGNTGKFSRLVARSGRNVISHDIDEIAIEKNYLFNKENDISNVLPLILDLSNPAPGLGWALAERDSIIQRIDGDVIMALAIIHHIVISNNVPMVEVANFFRQLANKLIIEFVPKGDSQVRRLLATREDIFPDYDIETFEKIFNEYFQIVARERIDETERTLFVMERR